MQYEVKLRASSTARNTQDCFLTEGNFSVCEYFVLFEKHADTLFVKGCIISHTSSN